MFLKTHVDAVVDEEGERSQGSRLETTVLRGSAGDDGSKLANEGTAEPEAAGLVKEGTDLRGGTAVSGREGQDEAVEVLEVIRLDHGEAVCIQKSGRDQSVISVGRQERISYSRVGGGLVGVHLAQDLLGERLSKLELLNLGTGALDTLNGIVGQLGNVAVERPGDDSNLGRHGGGGRG